jgi:hypothetical protein
MMSAMKPAVHAIGQRKVFLSQKIVRDEMLEAGMVPG